MKNKSKSKFKRGSLVQFGAYGTDSYNVDTYIHVWRRKTDAEFAEYVNLMGPLDDAGEPRVNSGWRSTAIIPGAIALVVEPHVKNPRTWGFPGCGRWCTISFVNDGHIYMCDKKYITLLDQ